MAKEAIWKIADDQYGVVGPHVIELANGKSTKVIINQYGFFKTSEIPPPGFAIYVRPADSTTAP